MSNCFKCKKIHDRFSELCIECFKKDQIFKQKCRSKTNNLLKKGFIEKKDKCQFGYCKHKNPKLQMHHEDYTKPDWIIWLCGRCHGLYHAGVIKGPKELLFSWEWRCSAKFNPKYYQEYRDEYLSKLTLARKYHIPFRPNLFGRI